MINYIIYIIFFVVGWYSIWISIIMLSMLFCNDLNNKIILFTKNKRGYINGKKEERN